MKKWYWFLISLGIVLVDQGMKYWVETNYLPYEPHSIIPMVNITLAYNTGAAFSFLSGIGGWHRWGLATFSTLMTILLIVWIVRLPKQARSQLLGVSLILGGAIGNLYDRAAMGHVIDFIDVFYKNYHWPVFNIADSAICIGAVLLLLDLRKNPS